MFKCQRIEFLRYINSRKAFVQLCRNYLEMELLSIFSAFFIFAPRKYAQQRSFSQSLLLRQENSFSTYLVQKSEDLLLLCLKNDIAVRNLFYERYYAKFLLRKRKSMPDSNFPKLSNRFFKNFIIKVKRMCKYIYWYLRRKHFQFVKSLRL